MRYLALLAFLLIGCTTVTGSKKFRAQDCAFYEGSFDNSGFRGIAPGLINAECTLDPKGASVCSVAFVDSTASIIRPYTGSFLQVMKDGKTFYLVEATNPTDHSQLRLFCNDTSCQLLQLFSSEAHEGFMCRPIGSPALKAVVEKQTLEL